MRSGLMCLQHARMQCIRSASLHVTTVRSIRMWAASWACVHTVHRVPSYCSSCTWDGSGHTLPREVHAIRVPARSRSKLYGWDTCTLCAVSSTGRLRITCSFSKSAILQLSYRRSSHSTRIPIHRAPSKTRAFERIWAKFLALSAYACEIASAHKAELRREVAGSRRDAALIAGDVARGSVRTHTVESKLGL